MRTRNYNWGILGAGKIAEKFTQDLATVDGAVLYAVASRSIDKAEEFAENHKVMISYGSYLELVEDENIDIIYVATPHSFHFEHTMLCLKHQKAVLCEKPFGLNLGQVETMIAMAKEKNVFLMEALWTQFLPHFQFVIDLKESKKYGELLGLDADFGFSAAFDADNRLYNKELGGGSLMDVGIYPVFLALSLLGYPENIAAEASIGTTGVDKNCSMQLYYPNGAKAVLYSAINETTPITATLRFEKATVIINSRFHEPSSVSIETDGNIETKDFPITTHGYNFEAAHVQDMIEENRIESNLMTFEKSKNLISILDRIRKEINLEY